VYCRAPALLRVALNQRRAGDLLCSAVDRQRPPIPSHHACTGRAIRGSRAPVARWQSQHRRRCLARSSAGRRWPWTHAFGLGGFGLGGSASTGTCYRAASPPGDTCGSTGPPGCLGGSCSPRCARGRDAVPPTIRRAQGHRLHRSTTRHSIALLSSDRCRPRRSTSTEAGTQTFPRKGYPTISSTILPESRDSRLPGICRFRERVERLAQRAGVPHGPARGWPRGSGAAAAHAAWLAAGP
jgi:hypothetical protein